MWFRKFMKMAPEGDEGGSNGGAEGGAGGEAAGGEAGAATGTEGGTSGAEGAAGTAAAAGKTSAEGGTEGGAAAKPVVPAAKGAEAKGDWPDDWREKLANGDAKRLKSLQRFASPAALTDSYLAAQERIRSGELKQALPKDAKPEEIAAWRAENGIPEAPEKYDLTFDSGLVIGKEDRPIIDGFLKAGHERNIDNEQAKGIIEWYYNEQERQTKERQDLDLRESQEAVDALNAEWGGNYRANINALEGLLTQFPEEVRDSLRGARLPDGRGLMNHPDVVRGFVKMALEINPAGTVVPGNGADPMKNINGRIEEIDKMMREDRKAYDKNEKVQAEYRQLLEAREKLNKRAA
jgi:hypothetical protein